MGKKVIGMGRKVAGPAGSRQRRWATLLSLVVLVAAGLFFVRTVLAVHDTGAFELEGNAVDDLVAGDDWENVYNENSDAEVASFTPDGDLNATIFTGGGSKDPQDVSQWAWKDGAGGLPDKDNLLHSFAARYSLPGTAAGGTCPNGTGDLDFPQDGIQSDEVPFDATVPCVVLFFGSDRYANDGDAQQGFWFLQNPVSTHYDSDDDGIVDSECDIKVGGATGFCDPTTGLAATHRNGDLLIISNFSNGGETSTISVYVWDDTVNGNLQLLQTSTAANCQTASAGDAFCGIVNPNDNTTSPWPFLDKAGNTSFRKGEFYEGGVNLSLLGLADECFASASSETRSSTSLTATLKDFVLGQFAACSSGLVTTPVPNSNVFPGATVGDSAVLTIAGTSTWSGTMKFYLCGPADLAPTSGVTQTTCLANGTQIGSDIAVNQDTTQPILSATTTVSTVGKYCWRGEFISATQGVPDATDASAGECFNVIQLQPAISTAQTFTIKDTATITVGAGAGNLTGSVRFRLYNNASCSTVAPNELLYDSGAIAVSGTSPQVKESGTTTITTSKPVLSWLVEYTSTNAGHTNVTSTCNTENASLTINNGPQ